MTRVERIKHEIRALTDKELSALRPWFLAYDSATWDKQIEADAASGRLDALAERALAEYRTGMRK